MSNAFFYCFNNNSNNFSDTRGRKSRYLVFNFYSSKSKRYTHIQTLQVISNDIQDKQTADKQTTCSEPTN